MAFLKVTLLLLVLANVQGFFLPRHSAKSEDLAYHKHHSRYHDTSGIRNPHHPGLHDHDHEDHATRTIVTHTDDDEPHDDHHHVRTITVKESGLKNHHQGFFSALFEGGGHKESRTTVHHHVHPPPAPRHRHHLDHHVDQHRTLWK